jgi:hypothetical protein
MQALYDVVAAALLHESPSDRRHLVIAFTDGVDGASVIRPSCCWTSHASRTP